MKLAPEVLPPAFYPVLLNLSAPNASGPAAHRATMLAAAVDADDGR